MSFFGSEIISGVVSWAVGLNIMSCEVSWVGLSSEMLFVFSNFPSNGFFSNSSEFPSVSERLF